MAARASTRPLRSLVHGFAAVFIGRPSARLNVMRWGSWPFLSLVAAATGVYFVLPPGAQFVLYSSIGVTAAVVMLAGTHRSRLEPRAAWLLLGMGVLLLAAGEIVYGESQPVPSPADMLYISAYPLLGLGLAGLSPSGLRMRGRTHIAIAAAATAVIAAVCWAFLILPTSPTDGVGLSSKIVAIGYPAMDLVLIGLLVRAASWERFANVRLRFIAAGLGSMLVADVGFAVQDFGTSYSLGATFDAAWMLSYGLLGAAILHQGWTHAFIDEDLGSEIDLTPALVTIPATVRVRERPVRQQVRGPLAHALTNDVRYGMVVVWTGRMLIALAGVAVLLATAWRSPDVVVLGSAYGICGGFMCIAGARFSRVAWVT